MTSHNQDGHRGHHRSPCKSKSLAIIFIRLALGLTISFAGCGAGLPATCDPADLPGTSDAGDSKPQFPVDQRASHLQERAKDASVDGLKSDYNIACTQNWLL